MSKIVKKGIFYAVLKAVQRIKHSKPVPTAIGAMLGGGLGATLGLLTIHLVAFGIGLGVLIGATVAAVFFPRNAE